MKKVLLISILVLLIAGNSFAENYYWTKAIGTPGNARCYGVDTDNSGNIYFTGFFQRTVNFAADWGGNDYKTAINNAQDIFITKINAKGTYAWTK